jgi:hypothetical protein
MVNDDKSPGPVAEIPRGYNEPLIFHITVNTISTYTVWQILPNRAQNTNIL